MQSRPRHGLLATTDGAEIYWERTGADQGSTALYLHGGPGSGSGWHYLEYFNLARDDVITLDQRGCGRSLPHAADALASLPNNTTQALIDDIELLRETLRVDRWTVIGLSWGSTLALAYAEAHPRRVNGLVLAAVTTTSREEVEWITQDLGRVFPEQWDALAHVARPALGERLVDALYRGITDSDPARRRQIAGAWGQWENTHVSLSLPPDPRWDDPAESLNLATLILHYWSHHAFLGDRGILDGLGTLTQIPIELIHGRLDLSSTLSVPWEVHTRLPHSRLTVLEREGHLGEGMFNAVRESITRLAAQTMPADDRAEREVGRTGLEPVTDGL